jgi:hypothetical protein
VTIDVDPGVTAPLIMDYQPATLGFLADPDAFVSTAGALANEVRAAGGQKRARGGGLHRRRLCQIFSAKHGQPRQGRPPHPPTTTRPPHTSPMRPPSRTIS